MKKWVLALFLVVSASGIASTPTAYSEVGTFLKKYHRPFTLLVVGDAADFCAYTARQFPTSCVVLWRGDAIFEPAKRYPSSFVMLVAPISQDALKELAECEHFDVTLIFEKLDNALLELYAKLGDYLIISVPDQSVVPTVFMRMHHARRLSSGSNLCLLHTPKNNLFKSRWKTPTSTRNYKIKSTFEKKLLYKPQDKPYVWQKWAPGINLYTFKALGGIIPTPAQLKRAILHEAQKHPEHPDMFPNNFIVQGSKVLLIDGYQKRNEVTAAYCLQQTWEIMGLVDVEPEQE